METEKKSYNAFCKKCQKETEQKRCESGAEVYDICQVCFELNNLRFDGFHVKHGLYFRRLNDGGVMIFKREKIEATWNCKGYDCTTFIEIINSDVWASVICSVSDKGENLERWNEIKKFHL